MLLLMDSLCVCTRQTETSHRHKERAATIEENARKKESSPMTIIKMNA